MRNLFIALAIAGGSSSAFAQFNESGINAGFFDSSNEKTINFSEFHLPPLSDFGSLTVESRLFRGR